MIAKLKRGIIDVTLRWQPYGIHMSVARFRDAEFIINFCV